MATHMIFARRLPFDWDTGIELQSITVEVPKSLVDFVILDSRGSMAFAEAKSGIKLKTKPFEKAISSFVDVYLNLVHTYHRTFGKECDRLLLVVGRRAEPAIRDHLAEVIKRFARVDGRPDLADAPGSAAERKPFEHFLSIVRKKWRAITGAIPSPEQLSDFLHVIRIVHLELGTDERDERMAVDLLDEREAARNGLGGWRALCDLAQSSAENGNTGFGLADITGAFSRAGVHIALGPASLQADVDSLIGQARSEAAALEGSTRLKLRGRDVNLRSTIARDLHAVLGSGPSFVTGVPGAGKSRTLHDLFQLCVGSHCPALLARVDSTFGQSLAHEQTKTIQTMRAWSQRSGQPSLLLIDGFDQARAADLRQPFLELMQRVREDTGWSIAASMRQWDLEQLDGSSEESILQGIFRTGGDVPDRYRTSRVSRLRTFCIPRLSDEELQLAIDAGTDALRAALDIGIINDLARTPFNLELLTWLTENDSQDIGAANTQPRLIQQYWRRRVSAGQGELRESVLSRLAATMLAERRTILPISKIPDYQQCIETIRQLLSAGVLEETRAFGNHGEAQLSFGHTLFFDYAVAAYVLAEPSRRQQALSDGATLTLITPSIQMHFDLYWDGDDDEGHSKYWDQILNLAEAGKSPSISLILAVSSATRKAVNRSELAPLIAALGMENRRGKAIVVVDALVRSIEASGVDLGARGGEPWAALLAGLIAGPQQGVDAAGTTLRLEQLLLARSANLDAQTYGEAGAAARALLRGFTAS